MKFVLSIALLLVAGCATTMDINGKVYHGGLQGAAVNMMAANICDSAWVKPDSCIACGEGWLWRMFNGK